jgi:hypothetical protein
MSKFVTEPDEKAFRGNEAGPPLTANALIGDLGLMYASREDQRRAIAEWLEQNPAHDLLLGTLRAADLI